MYSFGPPHMAKRRRDVLFELTYSSYVRTRDVTLKTSQRRWIIGRSGKRWSGISVLAARHHDDDDMHMNILHIWIFDVFVFGYVANWPYRFCFVKCCFQDLFKSSESYSCVLYVFSTESRGFIDTKVLTRPQLSRNLVLSFLRDQIFVWSTTNLPQAKHFLRVCWPCLQ